MSRVAGRAAVRKEPDPALHLLGVVVGGPGQERHPLVGVGHGPPGPSHGQGVAAHDAGGGPNGDDEPGRTVEDVLALLDKMEAKS